LDVISDIYLNSKLDVVEIKKEKGVVIGEINMYRDNPMAHVQSLWTKVLYGDQPAGWDIAGTKESVLGLTRKELLDYMNTQYNSSNTIICIAGNISKETNKIKEYFSNIKKKETIDKSKVIEEQIKPEVILETRNTDQTHFFLGVRAYNLFHKQRFSLELLALILGGMMSSRLFSSVRERLGLCYYIKTSASIDPDTGFLVTQAGVDNTKVEKVIKIILKEYRKIAQKKISNRELKKVKDHFKGKMTLLFEASDTRASFYAAQELLEKKILTPEQIYAKINKVSIDDILKVSKDIFKPEKLNLALIGPFKDKTKFQKLLWIKKNY